MAKDLSNIDDAKLVTSETVKVNIDTGENDLFQMTLDVQQHMQEKYYPDVEAMFMEDQMLISTRAIIHEVLEVENEVNWKHWKKPVDIDDEKIADELVDVFIFFMNLMNASEMTAKELIERTLDKIDINIERQKTGY